MTADRAADDDLQAAIAAAGERTSSEPVGHDAPSRSCEWARRDVRRTGCIVASNMQDAVLVDLAAKVAAGRRRAVPRHRLPLRRDHRHPRRRRARCTTSTIVNVAAGAHRRRAGRRVRPRPVRARPGPVLLPAQGRPAASARWRATTPGSPACAGSRRRPARTPRWSPGTRSTAWSRSTRIAAWTDEDVDAYIAEHGVLVNPLVDGGLPVDRLRAPAPSSRCRAPTRAPAAGPGIAKTECGLHA